MLRCATLKQIEAISPLLATKQGVAMPRQMELQTNHTAARVQLLPWRDHLIVGSLAGVLAVNRLPRKQLTVDS